MAERNPEWLDGKPEIAEKDEEKRRVLAGNRSCMAMLPEVKDFVFTLRTLGSHRKEGGYRSSSKPCRSLVSHQSHWYI